MIVEENNHKRVKLKNHIEHSLTDFIVIDVDNGYKALTIAQEQIPSLIIIITICR